MPRKEIEPHTFLLSLNTDDEEEEEEEEESPCLSLTQISAIQTRLALRVPSGVRSDDSGRASCPESGFSHRDYILDRFTVGLDLTRRRTRIMTMILEPLLDRNKKWCPSDRDICRLVPIWIQIYVAPSLMLMAVHNGNKWFMTHHPTCPISSFPG